MKIKILVIALISIPIFTFCKKDNNANKISITGITVRDMYGNMYGTIDTTDWLINDNWQADVLDLFSRNKNITTDKTPPMVGIVGAFPNPAFDYIRFSFSVDTNMVYDIRIVDSNLNIILKIDSLRTSFILNRDSKFIKGTFYRIYYMIYSTDKVNRGHGDFKFAN